MGIVGVERITTDGVILARSVERFYKPWLKGLESQP